MEFLILAAQNLERQYYQKTKYMYGPDGFMYEYTPVYGLKDTAYEIFEKYGVPVSFRKILFVVDKEVFGTRKRAIEVFSKMRFILYNLDKIYIGKSGRIEDFSQGYVDDYLTINGLGIQTNNKENIEMFIYDLKLNEIYDNYLKALSKITSINCESEKITNIKSKPILKFKNYHFNNYFEPSRIKTISKNFYGGICPDDVRPSIFPLEKIDEKKEKKKVRKVG